MNAGQSAFLCIQSQVYGRTIYPQNEIFPDANGNWTAIGYYKSAGYSYDTFVAVAETADAAAVLASTTNRANGISALPAGSKMISPVSVFRRE